MNALLTGIFSKFNGAPETAIHASLTGRMYSRYAPPNTTYPYAVVTIPAMAGDWDFTSNYDDVDIQFNLYSQSASESEIGTLYTNLRALYDDVTLTVTGYTHLYCQYDTAWMLSDPEENIREYVIQYNILLQS